MSLKIALAQIDTLIGDFDNNLVKIKSNIDKAIELGADLVVFPELSICGYPPMDFLNFKDFVDKSIEKITELATDYPNIGIIVGGPSINNDPNGKDLFNSAYYLYEGSIRNVINKSLLPNYDVFDEYRYFQQAYGNLCISHNNVRIALTICEDIWNVNDNPLYTFIPMDELNYYKPELAINISASPFSHSHNVDRIKVLQTNAKQFNIPFYYVNTIGAQTELIFDGRSGVYFADGSYNQMSHINEELRIFDSSISSVEDVNLEYNKYRDIYSALIIGIKGYFKKLNFKTAILGMSGGVDSALVLALAYQALGPENILPVLMPSEYSSLGSIDDSLDMIHRIGCDHKIIPIANVFEELKTTMAPHFGKKPEDLTEENMQGRIRGIMLMALSNKLGNIVLNTSNKSELAVGYSTMYGDSIGAISVIGDLYKTEVYELCRYINNEYNNIIPENILNKEPSAELRPGQKDSDSLPSYNILDAILFQYIELERGPDEIVELGFDVELVKKILKMVNRTEYKRFQAPPILRMSDKAFGSGRRIPIVAKYLE